MAFVTFDDRQTHHQPAVATPDIQLPLQPRQSLIDSLRTRLGGVTSPLSQVPRSLPSVEAVISLLRHSTAKAASGANELRRASNQAADKLSAPNSAPRQRLRHAHSQYISRDSTPRRLRRSRSDLEACHDDSLYIEHEINKLRAEMADLRSGDSFDYGDENYTFVMPAAGSYEDMSQVLAPPTCFVDGMPGTTSEMPASALVIDLDKEVANLNQLLADSGTRALYCEINKMRTAAPAHSLKASTRLFERAQTYAAYMDSTTWPGKGKEKCSELQPGTLKQYNWIRIISAPRLNAEACMTKWRDGKNARHVAAVPADRVHHADGCACREKVVFEALTHRQWTHIGICRSGDGRYIVELAGPPGLEKLHTAGPEVRLRRDGSVAPPPRTSSKAQIVVGYGHPPPKLLRPSSPALRHVAGESDLRETCLSQKTAEVDEPSHHHHRLGMKRPPIARKAQTDATAITELSFDYGVIAPKPLVIRKPVRPGVKTRKTYESSVYSREVHEDKAMAAEEFKKLDLSHIAQHQELLKAYYQDKRPGVKTRDSEQSRCFFGKNHDGC